MSEASVGRSAGFDNSDPIARARAPALGYDAGAELSARSISTSRCSTSPYRRGWQACRGRDEDRTKGARQCK